MCSQIKAPENTLHQNYAGCGIKSKSQFFEQGLHKGFKELKKLYQVNEKTDPVLKPPITLFK